MLSSFTLTTILLFALLRISKSNNNFLKHYFFVPARKSTTNAIQLGGLALGVGFFFSMFACILFPELFDIFSKKDLRIVENFIAGGVLINIYGYLDDRIELRPTAKLAGQIISVILFATLSSHLMTIHHSQIVFLITCFWGLGVVNGSNLLDGLDTLTLKIGLVSYSIFLFLGYYYGSPNLIVCSLLFMSSLLAFYPFNREPAKIHLGEIGGSLVGFSMLLLSSLLWDAVKADDWSPVRSGVLAIIPLTLPMVELGVSFLRRIANHKSPFKGDKLHLHHILNREYGLSPSAVANIFSFGYLITMAGAIFLQIHIHPFVALFSLIVLQVLIYVIVGWSYWKPDVSRNFGAKTLLNFLRKKDITIIESGMIDNFKLTVLDEEQESDESDAA